VKFPIGGIVRERENAGFEESSNQDLVQFQNRQYSLDERRCVKVKRIFEYKVYLQFIFVFYLINFVIYFSQSSWAENLINLNNFST
jgi:hypothetical protein